jgi:hypothetical protein
MFKTINKPLYFKQPEIHFSCQVLEKLETRLLLALQTLFLRLSALAVRALRVRLIFNRAKCCLLHLNFIIFMTSPPNGF